MQARYYDPVIGRFYSNDPIGFRGIHSFNRYAYANSNPYKYIDPNGMESDLTESQKRHDKAVKEAKKQLRRRGYKHFVENVRIKVNTGDGDSSIRVVDIIATMGAETLGQGYFVEVKTVAKKSSRGASILRKFDRISSSLSVISKIVRGAQVANQMRKDIALNELGGTIQGTGETITTGTMVWFIYEHNKGGMKQKGPGFPIIRGEGVQKEFEKQFID